MIGRVDNEIRSEICSHLGYARAPEEVEEGHLT